MTKIEQLRLFLNFWYSPWGAAKGEVWEAFSHDRPFNDASAEEVCRHILKGDGSSYRWQEIESYKPRPPMTNEQLADFLATAFEQFGKIPEGKDMPGNAITLWKAMIHGWDRVATHLRAYRER